MKSEMQAGMQLNNESQKETFWDKLVWLLMVAFFAVILLAERLTYGRYILLAATALALLASVAKRGGLLRIQLGAFQWYALAFAAFALLSSLWARRPTDATTKGTTVVEIVICLSVFYWHYVQNRSVEPLLKAIMWGAYVVVIYTLMEYGVDGVMAAVEEEERFATEFANINSVAMTAAMAVVINFFFLRKGKQWVAAVFSLPALLLLGASGSRKAVLLLFIGMLAVMVMTVRSRSGAVRILKTAGVMLVAFAAVRLILTLPVFGVAAERLDTMIQGVFGIGETDSSTEKRLAFIDIGWEVFLQHPILGVGIGNSHIYLWESIGLNTYLHNNFVELLSGGGIIGFAVYYAMYVYLYAKLWKYRRADQSCFIICFILLSLTLVLDYGMVSYYDKIQWFYLMTIFLGVEILKGKSGEQYELQEAVESGN